MSDGPKILIATCQTWSSTTALPRLFAEAGSHVTAVSPGPLGLCAHVDAHVTCAREPKLAAADVVRMLETSDFDWVVVADELLLEALAASHDPSAPAAWAPFDVRDERIARFHFSKHAFVEFAETFAIPIPPSRFVTNLAAASAFVTDVGYPIVVRGDRGFAGSDIVVAADESALHRSVAATIATYGRAALQRFVRGSTVSVSVLYRRGVPVAYTAYRTTCGYPTPTSASTRHETFDHPDIETIVRRIGAIGTFDGMAGIDLMHDATTDELFAIEINPRPTLGFTGTRANRAYFAPAIRRFLEGTREPLAAARDIPRVQTYFPSHLFFAMLRPNETDAPAVRSALGEFQPGDWRVALWEFARFVKDRLASAARAFAAEDGTRDRPSSVVRYDAATPTISV